MKDRFGINMKRWCREHEAEVSRALASGGVNDETAQRHMRKLAYLQHERLIHLIVLVMTVLGELFLLDLTLLHPELNPGAALLMLGIAVLLCFYVAHYFLLENTVQRWYLLTERLLDARRGQGQQNAPAK